MMAMSVAGAAGTLLAPGPPKPPPLPDMNSSAMNPDGTHKSNAIVRIGNDGLTEQDDNSPDYVPFTEKRTTGMSLGGLGRGGLVL